MWIYAATIFIGAFLLFQVQPLISRFVLPWFGGSTAVWTTSLLFFQVLLLGGYGFAHWSVRKLSPTAQLVVQSLLIFGAVLLLPIIPAGSWKPGPAANPTGHILLLLGAVVGLPYLMLSTTAPLVQAWYARTYPGASPYRLYALSNVGALLALLSYPFLVEPVLALTAQARFWSLGFIIYGLFCVWCGLRSRRHQTTRAVGGDGESTSARQHVPVPKKGDWFLWLLLPAFASVMLLAVTNQMCQDIAVVPLLWVLPLSLYLLSFIICFSNEKGYARPLFSPLLLLSLVLLTYVLYRGIEVDILIQIGALSATLFLCCMVCHGELVRLKPHPRHLTAFYLMVAAGGALGGIFVALVAPLVFGAYLELHVGMVGTVVLWLAVVYRDRSGALYRGRPIWAWALLSLLAVGLWTALGSQALQSVRGWGTVERNFYGVIRTQTAWDPEYGDEHRSLYHGGINHGFQYLGPANRREPVSYFGRESGIGLAARLLPRESRRRIGVIGLGVGTVAAYAREGDEIRFYEINPAVLAVATTLFSYLEDCPADWDVVLGDGRLSMEQELEVSGGKGRGYDLLVLDAFSGDAPPVHLLTREAFAIYLAHLKEDGILAINVTNRHIDMTPIVWGLAREYAMKAVLIKNDDDAPHGLYEASWMLVTNNSQWLEHREVQAAVASVAANSEQHVDHIRIWTDDYSNLFQLLMD